MNCDQCGKALAEGASFCSHCGSPQRTSINPPPVVTSAPKRPLGPHGGPEAKTRALVPPHAKPTVAVDLGAEVYGEPPAAVPAAAPRAEPAATPAAAFEPDSIPLPAVAPTPAPAEAIPRRPKINQPMRHHAGAFATPRRVQPWRRVLPRLLVVGGLLLGFCAVLPWQLGNETTFSWTVLQNEGDRLLRLRPLLIIGSAALALLFGLVALPMAGRGIVAAFVALPCLTIIPIATILRGTDGGTTALLLGDRLEEPVIAALVIPGLLLRSVYREDMFPRLLTSVGALVAIAPLLWPSEAGELPIVLIFSGALQTPLQPTLLASAVFVALLALSALWTWLPRALAGFCAVLAWLLVLRIAVFAAASLLAIPELASDYVTARIGDAILWPVASCVWTFLTGYGVAVAVGVILEKR